MYLCDFCGKTFTRCDNLRRHLKVSCRGEKITMENTIKNMCNEMSGGQPPAKKYKTEEQASTSNSVTCDCCNKRVPPSQLNFHRRTLEHRTNSCTPFSNGVEIIQSAFKGRIASYRVSTENQHTDHITFFSEAKYKIIKLLENVLKAHLAIKVNMELFAQYFLPTQECSDIKSFNTSNKIVDRSTDLSFVVDIFADMMISQTSEFQERDSGM